MPLATVSRKVSDLLDAPRVMGPEAWREIETKYGYGAMANAFSALARAGVIHPSPIETLDNAKNYSATFQVLDQNNHVIFHAGADTANPWPARVGFGELLLNGAHFRTIVTQSVDRTTSVMVTESDATPWSS